MPKARAPFRDRIILIPLHIPLSFASDYVPQTVRILKKRNTVILYDFRNPVLLSDIFRKPDAVLRAVREYAGILHKARGLYRVSPIYLFPGGLGNINSRAAALLLRLALRPANMPGLIVWGFHPLASAVAGYFADATVVYDCVDYFGRGSGADEWLESEEDRLFRKADIVAFNSDALYRKKTGRLPWLGAKSIVVACGCNTELFDGRGARDRSVSALPGKHIVYAGHINHRFDFRLVERLAISHPDWTIVIIGPVNEFQDIDRKCGVSRRYRSLAKIPNVVCTGPVPKKKLPPMLRAADVCFIPHRESLASVRFCNPMKAYEYLACGKPVVSERIAALTGLPGAVVATTGAGGFGAAVEKFLNKRAGMAAAARRIAVKNSWAEKITRITARLGETEAAGPAGKRDRTDGAGQ